MPYTLYIECVRFFILQNNTFEGVLITDGEISYAVFIYQCGAINWSNRAVLIGYKSGLIDSDTIARYHPASFSDTALQLGCNDLDTYMHPWENLIYRLPPLGKDNHHATSFIICMLM